MNERGRAAESQPSGLTIRNPSITSPVLKSSLNNTVQPAVCAVATHPKVWCVGASRARAALYVLALNGVVNAA